MSYTLILASALVTNFVPMGDKIVDAGHQALGKESPEKKKRSKRELRACIATANAMNQAVKEGTASPKLAKVAKHMKIRAKLELAEQNYSNNQYALSQVNKAAPVLEYIAPGISAVTAATAKVGQVNTAKSIVEYATESEDIQTTAVKTAQFVLPMVASVTSSLWMPVVTPLVPLVTPWIGIAAAGALGAMFIADAVNYIRV